MSGGSFNPAGSSFGHIGFNHRTDSWDATTDYAEGDTVLYATNGSTYYCHTDIAGSASNSNPADDLTHWHPYTTSELTLNSATATASSDLLAKFSDAVNRVAIGSNGERLYYSADNEIGWYNPAAGNTRQNIATRTNPGTLPVSERYAAREELETAYFLETEGLIMNNQNSGNVIGTTHRGTNNWIYDCIVGELKYGLLNDSGNALLRQPFTGNQIEKVGADIGTIRDGRFYRHLKTTHYGGLYDMSVLSATNISASSTSVNNTPGLDIRMTTDARWLQTARLDSSNLQINASSNDLEWKIFNEATSPNNRNLHVLDYLRGVGDTFTFLCAPADDPTSTTRTIWQIGGLRMRTRASYISGWYPTQSSDVFQHGGGLSQTLATNSGSYMQYGFMVPVQFNYWRTTLTQIAVAGNYEQIFLLDEAYQFNTPFFVAAENMSLGTGFLAKMQDGSWELHAGITSSVSGTSIAQTLRGSTSTALQTYPAHVVTRDHVCVSDPGYAGYTGSMLYWNGSTGHTDVDRTSELQATFGAAIRLRFFFNAWKSGQSVVSIQHGNVILSASVGTLTVGNNETVKQVKCFHQWFPRSGDGMDTSAASQHPTHGTLTVFVVTEEGNVWAAGTDNGISPVASGIGLPALPSGTANVNMVQLPGEWDGIVERVEVKCNAGVVNCRAVGRSSTSNLEMQLQVTNTVESSVAIVTRKSIFVQSYNASYTRRTPTNVGLRLRTSFFLTNDIDDTDRGFIPVCFYNIYDFGSGSNTTHTSSGTRRMRWSRGDLPIGDIERVFFTNTNVVIINTLGDIYKARLNSGLETVVAAQTPLKLTLCRNGSSGLFGNDYYPGNRDW